MLLRRFNQEGILEFRKELLEIRVNPEKDIRNDLLEDPSFTELVQPEIEVKKKHLSLRREAAECFRDILHLLDNSIVTKDAGLWTWMTLFYFDEVCPKTDGYRKVKNDYYYAFEPNNPRHFYRHLLFISWRIIMLAPEHNRLFLDVPLKTLDGGTTEVMKRLFLTRINCIFEVLDRIYFDPKTSRIRKGVVNSQKVTPGDLVHRFPLRIRQLQMTYDLQSLDADQMIEMLGEEFIFDQKEISVP